MKIRNESLRKSTCHASPADTLSNLTLSTVVPESIKAASMVAMV